MPCQMLNVRYSLDIAVTSTFYCFNLSCNYHGEIQKRGPSQPSPYLEVVLVAGARHVALVAQQRPEGGGGEERPGVVARGAGLEVVPGEGGEGAAAPLRHEGGERSDERSGWDSVGPHIHHRDGRHSAVGVTACIY